MTVKQRVAVGLLTISVGGFAAWKASEGFEPKAMIPTKGDVPTLGYGSTKYEDGSKVKMGDTITPQRAELLARNLIRQDERALAASIPGARLHQHEFDAYLDFAGQYGMGNWRQSSMRRHVMAGQYANACAALLRYRFAAGYDCSTLVAGKPNKRCYGVWTRQLERHDRCMGAS